MRKTTPLLTLLILLAALTHAQDTPKKQQKPGKSNEISSGAYIPLKQFSSTHIVGFSLSYYRTAGHLGKLDSLPAKRLSWIANLAAEYYLGQKELVTGYPLKYASFTELRLFGGLLFNAGERTNLQLTAGPAFSIYSGHTEFNYGANLAFAYYPTRRIALQPGIILMKFNHANPIWAAGLKIGFDF